MQRYYSNFACKVIEVLMQVYLMLYCANFCTFFILHLMFGCSKYFIYFRGIVSGDSRKIFQGGH